QGNRQQKLALLAGQAQIKSGTATASRGGEKEKPRPLSGFAIGASTWRVERSRFAPYQDPLKRNSHTLARSRLTGNDPSTKENHGDIFATIKSSYGAAWGLP